MTAIAAIRTMEENIQKYDRRGFGSTLFKLNPHIHENAHVDTVKYLDSRKGNIINKAYQVDLGKGLVKKSKQSYIQSQKMAGLLYTRMMAREWYKALKDLEKLGPQTLDRNDTIRNMAMKWDLEFKKLSKTARIFATMGFLDGFKLMSEELSVGKYNSAKDLRIFKVLPHASESASELQLLDEGVLKMYYKEYNNIISNKDLLNFQKNRKRPQLSSWDVIIKRDCK